MGAAIGPVTAGWLLGHFYWGSVFFLNVPLVVLALVAGRWLVPTSRDESHVALDLTGAALSIVGLSALVYGIIEAPNYGWTDPVVVGAFVVATVVLAAFVVWELRSQHPMLDLTFFKNPQFSAASAAIMLVFFAVFGTFFLLTQYLQVVRSYTPLEAGVRTLPMAATMMIMAPMSARFVERFGARAVVSAGLTFVAAGLFLASLLGATTPYFWLAGVLVVMATGMSISMAPATASIMSSLPLRKAGVGSAWNDTTRELGGALGVAVLGSVMASQYTSELTGRLGGVPAEIGRVAETSVGAAVQISTELPATLGDALSAAAKTAFMDAMGVALVVAAGVSLVAAAVVRRYLPGPIEVIAHGEVAEPAETGEPASATLPA